MSTLLKLAALSGAFAVGLGAFGAHGLKSRGVAEADLKVWATAAQYHLAHSVGLLALAVAPEKLKTGAMAACFAVGNLLFAGSLYMMVLTGNRKLGIITPIGGTFYLLGWAMPLLTDMAGGAGGMKDL